MQTRVSRLFRQFPPRAIRRLLPAFALAFAASPASAQYFIQFGSGGESDRGTSNWVVGTGVDARLPLAPVSAGLVAQATIPGDLDDGWPVRAYGLLRAEFLPTPLIRAYVGAGAGYSMVLAPEVDIEGSPAGIAIGGIGVGRIHIEVQYQRDFREEPVNRWATVVGVAF